MEHFLRIPHRNMSASWWNKYLKKSGKTQKNSETELDLLTLSLETQLCQCSAASLIRSRFLATETLMVENSVPLMAYQ